MADFVFMVEEYFVKVGKKALLRRFHILEISLHLILFRGKATKTNSHAEQTNKRLQGFYCLCINHFIWHDWIGAKDRFLGLAHEFQPVCFNPLFL